MGVSLLAPSLLDAAEDFAAGVLSGAIAGLGGSSLEGLEEGLAEGLAGFGEIDSFPRSDLLLVVLSCCALRANMAEMLVSSTLLEEMAS